MSLITSTSELCDKGCRWPNPLCHKDNCPLRVTQAEAGLSPAPDEDAGLAARPGPLAAFRLSLAFLTRLPLPAPTVGHPGALAASMHLFPMVGVVVGGIGGIVYGLAALGLPPFLAASLAVAATLLTTGALHEDGLSDCADGFGGGGDPARKLAIMKDSRIGSYGMLAGALGLLLRIGAIAALGKPWLVLGAMIAAHALARTALPIVMRILAPVRPKGLGASIGRPDAATAGIGATLCLLVLVLALPIGSGLAAMLGAVAGAAGMAWVAWRQIGGFTGDVLGAVEQVAEAGALLAIVAVL